VVCISSEPIHVRFFLSFLFFLLGDAWKMVGLACPVWLSYQIFYGKKNNIQVTLSFFPVKKLNKLCGLV
jgi:hypothetical protein